MEKKEKLRLRDMLRRLAKRSLKRKVILKELINMSWLDKLGGILGFANKFAKEDMRRFQGGEEVDMFDVTPGHLPRDSQRTIDLTREYLKDYDDRDFRIEPLDWDRLQRAEKHFPYRFRYGKPSFSLGEPGQDVGAAPRTRIDWTSQNPTGKGYIPGEGQGRIRGRGAPVYNMRDYDDEGY
jgi:hypothetical protein